MELPSVHLLTCEKRQSVSAETLARFCRTDWPAKPRVHFDPVREDDAPAWGTSARAKRFTDCFAMMLRAALEETKSDSDWFLFLEDDLDFHPRTGSLVSAWGALGDSRCSFASLFNPSLQINSRFPATPRAFAAEPSSFLGAQALLVRRIAAQWALEQWDSLRGLTSQRLATIAGRERPIWIHKPSLVQHVSVDSSWGARMQRASDFDPGWQPEKPWIQV